MASSGTTQVSSICLPHLSKRVAQVSSSSQQVGSSNRDSKYQDKRELASTGVQEKVSLLIMGKAEVQERTLKPTSTFSAPAYITFANIILTKVSHVSKSSIQVGWDYKAIGQRV